MGGSTMTDAAGADPDSDPPRGPALSVERCLELLAGAEIEVEGQVAWSSNVTLICRLRQAEDEILAIYKPRLGERPLWDFSAGSLQLRELAAWRVSEALGWQLVPPTVLREGPHGPGMLQAFIPHDPNLHYLEMPAPDPQTVARIAAFDLVINNADRKSGHVLLGEDDRLWAIDHGICFHVEPKLRTVIWEMAGERLPTGMLADLARFQSSLSLVDSPLRLDLAPLLSPDEITMLGQRTAELLAAGAYPNPDPERRMVPWPPI
jgi:hypothetical protein